MRLFTRVLNAFPRTKQCLFRWLYQYLAGYTFPDWTFMNYGYAPARGEPHTVVLDTLDEPDRYCIQLYNRVVQDTDLRDCRLLEVGCGRGGGIAYLHRYHKPRFSMGFDLSSRQVAFCSGRHLHSGLHFNVGDACNLPIGDSSTDVVVNVESSHCYPSRYAFFCEVYRVLRRGGTFCFADLYEAELEPEIDKALNDAGFFVAEKTDITASVQRAMRLDNDRKLALINLRAPWWLKRLFKIFAGTEDSRTYYSFDVGARKYTCWRLRKI